MLNRRGLLGAAVILALALAFIAALGARDPGIEVRDPARSAAVSIPGEAPSTVFAQLEAGRRTVRGKGEPEGAEAAGQGSDPEPEEERYGWVRGLVSDMNGAPVPGVAMALRQDTPQWKRLAAASDGRGEFSFEEVPVGTWRVEHETRRPPVWERMSGIVATIEVLEARETWVPVLLEGTRKLTGQVSLDLEQLGLEGDAGFVIELQLRPEWDPGTTVARAGVHSFARPPSEGPPVETDPEDDLFNHEVDNGEPEETPEWIAGAFRFERLRPGRYTLRIALEDNEFITAKVDGEPRSLHLYLEREVDLTHGDVELPPEELDYWRDFMKTALERD